MIDFNNVFVNTNSYNKSKYTHCDYLRAYAIKKLQSSVGNVSYKQFKNMIANNELKNCPFQVCNLTAAEEIFGPSLNILKGRTTDTKPTHVRASFLKFQRKS